MGSYVRGQLWAIGRKVAHSNRAKAFPSARPAASSAWLEEASFPIRLLSSVCLVALLTGPTAEVRKWLALDIGVIIPVSGPQPHALYAGGVYNVGRLW